MRYTKAALLVFGFGLTTGFVVAVGEFPEWGYVASAAMALGLVLLPVALFADGHGVAALRRVARFLARRVSRGRGKKGRRKARPAAPRRKTPVRAAAGRTPRRAR